MTMWVSITTYILLTSSVQHKQDPPLDQKGQAVYPFPSHQDAYEPRASHSERRRNLFWHYADQPLSQNICDVLCGHVTTQ